MKIRYDGSGNINAACVNASNLGGSTVVTVPDNAALLANPWKYKWNVSTSSLILREAVVLTTTAPLVDGIPTAAADGSTTIVVTVKAYTPSGTLDTSATFPVVVNDVNARPPVAPVASVTLVAGVATFSLTSASAKRMILAASSPNVFSGSLTAVFA